MRLHVAVVCVAAVSCGAAAAQQEDWAFPNPLRNDNVAATCDNWPAQQRSADPRAMQMIVGTWESTGMIPGTPGIMPDTPIQVRATNSPDGTFVVDRYGCFEMQSVPGMPSLGSSCATSQIYGQWVAHFAQDGSIAVVTLSAGTSFAGQALPVSCGISFFRPMSDGVLMDQQGNPSRRVGY
jgi:hypothetical protein